MQRPRHASRGGLRATDRAVRHPLRMTLAQAAPAATTPDAPVHRDWTSLGLAGYGAALGGLLFSVAHRGILDDGYITLSYGEVSHFLGPRDGLT